MATETPPAERRSPTRAQLHGEACIDCGSMMDGLVDAGFIYTRDREGGRLGWRVKSCPHHTGPNGERA